MVVWFPSASAVRCQEEVDVQEKMYHRHSEQGLGDVQFFRCFNCAIYIYKEN